MVETVKQFLFGFGSLIDLYPEPRLVKPLHAPRPSQEEALISDWIRVGTAISQATGHYIEQEKKSNTSEAA